MRPETAVVEPQFKILKPEPKMAAGPHTFVTVDVFSSERFLGDQLAIVSVRSDALSNEKKQQIAREFGYATTAFLHDTGPEGQARRVELFSPNEELRFAGHAILGVAHYIFQMLDGGAVIAVETPDAEPNLELNHSSFLTRAGLIQTHFDPERKVAAVEIPHDVHIHARETTKDEILAVQRTLITNPDTLKMRASHAIVSITRGLTFSLVDLTSSPSLLSELEPAEAPSPDLDAGWGVSPDQPSLSFCGCVYFVQLQTDFTEEPYITRLQVRVIEDGAEESGTASACCALAAYLALQKGGEDSRHAYAIEQGLEMGRPSLLCVEVRLNETGTGVSRITLSARAAFVMEGRLL